MHLDDLRAVDDVDVRVADAQRLGVRRNAVVYGQLNEPSLHKVVLDAFRLQVIQCIAMDSYYDPRACGGMYETYKPVIHQHTLNSTTVRTTRTQR